MASTLLSAFTQEAYMRGYLIPRLGELLGTLGRGIIASSVLFAAYHADQGAGGLAGSFLFGLLYGVIFAATRRLWPLVAAHAAYNLLVSIP
ncbi:MAG: CPBP family intramembrane metalloprotease [Planctomycetes bacterium]|nr:CPBP family intramembrane metalloprotease [Planctomycetota bacterium]